MGDRGSPMTTPDRVYAYICAFSRSHGGNAPTLRQICAGTGISSTSVVRFHLDKLVKAGRIHYVEQHLCVTGAVWTALGVERVGE